MSERLWLSRLKLNARHRDAAGALRDAQSLHALTMRCLPSGVTRAQASLLHHANLRSGTLLVQSAVEPQWPTTPAFRAQTKEITPFIESVVDGERLRFTLRAVPMRRQSATLSNGRLMKEPGEHALRTDPERIAWLERLIQPTARLVYRPMISVEAERVGHRNGRRFAHRPVLFDGVLQVEDAQTLHTLVAKGVGRAKSYGNGLLMLARLPDA